MKKMKRLLFTLLCLCTIFCCSVMPVNAKDPCKKHNFKTVRITRNCTKPSVEYLRCKNCGCNETKRLPSIGHNYRLSNGGKKATCTTSGYTYSKCSNCGKVKKNTIKTKGHSYRTVDKKRLSGNRWKYKKKCRNCGKTVYETK